MKITVFTAAYNRGKLIPRLYESLKRQTFKDFEWVVINDGSTDNTDELFQNTILPDEHFFDITYRVKENGGKHRAINKGLELARGELFFILDSDDYITDDALEKANKAELTIPNEKKNSFAGVMGLKGYSETDMVGSTFSGAEYLDITYLQQFKNNIFGDKAEFYYTELLKKYPFPEFDGEIFLDEGVVWDKIAFDGYKLRFFNEIVYICDYLDDGLTRNVSNHKITSYRGHGLHIYQSYKFGRTSYMRSWEVFLDYFYKHKHQHTTFEIAELLHQKPVPFLIRINIQRVIYKVKCLMGKG